MSNIKSINEIKTKESFVDGQRAAIKGLIEKEKIVVGEAKARELDQPSVLEALGQLQQEEHERPVEVFGKLLSALSKDVLPLASKPIMLNLYTAHGAPALDIDVVASDKHKEEITSGALKNVLSVGLRLIAIARTKQRRFLVLDEPDHWIKPENVPQFVSVLNKIINELGFQILMISHHPTEYFQKTAKCVHLERNSDGKIEVVGDLETSQHSGFSALRLVNFESHEDTTIPLHNGMTVLTGENLIGKSAFVRGLKALINGNIPSDRVIRHTPDEASACRVEIKLDNGNWIGWRRARKLNTSMRHKNKFYIRADDCDAEKESEFLVAEDSSDTVPDFIREITCIDDNGKVDVHVASQEESVFLINNTTKATDRAKLLALGSEVNVLHAMIDKNRTESRKDKDVIREGEKRLGRWVMQMTTTDGQIERVKKEIASMGLIESEINNKKQLLNEIPLLVKKVANCKKSVSFNGRVKGLMRKLSAPPTLHNVENLRKTLEKIENSKKIMLVKVPKTMSGLAPVHDVIGLSLTLKKINKYKKINIAGESLPKIANSMPKNDFVSPKEAFVLAESIEKLKHAVINLVNEEMAINTAMREMVLIEQEKNDFWESVKVCPLCEKPH